MSLKKVILDSGEVAGVNWEITGISAACGFEIRAEFDGIKRCGYKSHPLLLVSEPARQKLAIELVLPSVAKQLGLVAVTGRQAAEELRRLKGDGSEAEAAKRLADRWVRLEAAGERALEAV
jgi:hypothetical protein